MLNTGTDDELFRRYCQEHGLRASPKVDDDTFVRPLLELMAQQLSAFPLGDDRGRSADFVRIGFVDRRSPNAFVDAWDGGAIVCLHSGMLLSILEAAIQLQDKIGAFDTQVKEAGKLADANLEDPIGMTSYLAALKDLDRDESLFEPPEGRQEEATWRATSFLSAGLQFVVLHEFAHVAFGHLGYLGNVGRTPKLNEVAELTSPHSDENAETRYFFEHEADVFALETLLRSALGRQLSGSEERHAAGEEIFMVLISYLTTVFGWITLENELGRSSQSTHPLSYERLFALPMAVQGLLGEQTAYEEPLGFALNRCRVLLSQIIPKYPKFASIARVFSPEALAGIEGKVDWMRSMDAKTSVRLDYRL